jgi:hypothetical protein
MHPGSITVRTTRVRTLLGYVQKGGNGFVDPPKTGERALALLFSGLGEFSLLLVLWCIARYNSNLTGAQLSILETPSPASFCIRRAEVRNSDHGGRRRRVEG